MITGRSKHRPPSVRSASVSWGFQALCECRPGQIQSSCELWVTLAVLIPSLFLLSLAIHVSLNPRPTQCRLCCRKRRFGLAPFRRSINAAFVALPFRKGCKDLAALHISGGPTRSALTDRALFAGPLWEATPLRSLGLTGAVLSSSVDPSGSNFDVGAPKKYLSDGFWVHVKTQSLVEVHQMVGLSCEPEVSQNIWVVSVIWL